MGCIMDNFCVCCGAIIPEGCMVYPICEIAADGGAVTDVVNGNVVIGE